MPIIGSSASQNTKTFLNPYPVGSTGPGSGIVFYDAGSTLSWGRYLEVATTASSPSWTNQSPPWSNFTETLIGTTSTAIGTGMSNTLKMVAQTSSVDFTVGMVSRAYTGGGYSSTSNGWFAGSKDDINQLYIQRNIVGDLGNATYWTSSEATGSTAWCHLFFDNVQDARNKINGRSLRPIRAF